ncbi:MAG: hypothetical protein EXR79_06510 [Myxococcales bacterium]|nr:hypothetical protein [Myxococcales bacterium]
MRKFLVIVPVLAAAAFVVVSRAAPAGGQAAVPTVVTVPTVATVAAVAPAAPPDVRGAAPAATPTSEGKQYAVDAAHVDLKSGANGTATLTIKPTKGFKFNKEYPSKFTVAATPFARATKEKLTLKDGDVKISGTDGVVTIPLAGVAAGAGTIVVTGNFSICNAEQCFMLRNEALALQVTVK